MPPLRTVARPEGRSLGDSPVSHSIFGDCPLPLLQLQTFVALEAQLEVVVREPGEGRPLAEVAPHWIVTPPAPASLTTIPFRAGAFLGAAGFFIMPIF